MKKLQSILAVVILAVTISACGGGGAKKPEDVAKTFIKAINNEDYATAKEHATEETKKMLSMMESMMGAMGGDKKKKTGEFKKVKDTKVEGKEATVTYCCNKEGKDDKVELKKVDGEWKVHMKKEAPGGGAGAGAGSGGGAGS